MLAAVAVAGPQIGARLHTHLSDRALRIMFAGVMVFAGAVMLVKAFI